MVKILFQCSLTFSLVWKCDGTVNKACPKVHTCDIANVISNIFNFLMLSTFPSRSLFNAHSPSTLIWKCDGISFVSGPTPPNCLTFVFAILVSMRLGVEKVIFMPKPLKHKRCWCSSRKLCSNVESYIFVWKVIFRCGESYIYAQASEAQAHLVRLIQGSHD